MADLTEKLQKLNILVEQFRKNIDHYKTLEYKEARVRTDFIDKFFTLLDWDISNEGGDTEDFRDVIIEDNLEIQGAQKAPDYSFRIGGNRVFFVEAKKPSVNLKDAIDPAFQVRRYGYTAKLPVSILTDFEEFAIYDTTLKPNKNDKSSFARLFYCRFDEYEKNFEFIYNTFSKGAVKKSSIKEYIEGVGIKKGASAVDKEFLKLIEDWRSHLAKNIALRNLSLDIDQLNLAVQKIIDRIIFLRIAEDKEIELYENLLSISKETKAYQSLVTYFEKANRKYNSELFKKDQLIDELKVDNDVLLDIIQNLYYPDSPYAFSVLPVEILGNIYEQFLGKTIRLTAGHQAKIEEKPEVRKAGGVYYTPQYIVDYIVQNTVGEKIKDKSPEEIEKITILDPACGSGSFLLGAYSYLLNYHLKYYTQKENVAKAIKCKAIYQFGEKSYHLTIQEKQKILLNNIYGVDIDKQATEVTKLSLMLKLLEGENHESAGQLFKQTDLKLLPTLSDNIKCGNSLIGVSFYRDKNLDLFGKEDLGKANVFDWEKEFPDIYKQNNGFDIILGNPPYISFQNKDISYDNYYKEKYSSATGKYDIYVIFNEKALELVNNNGLVCFIQPHKFTNSDFGKGLRRLLVNNKYLYKLISFSENDVFENAIAYSSLVFYKKEKHDNLLFYLFPQMKSDNIAKHLNELESESFEFIDYNNLNENPWVLKNNRELLLLNKLLSTKHTLGEIANITQGIIPGSDPIYYLKIHKKQSNKYVCSSQSDTEEFELEKDILRPIIKGDNVNRYYKSEDKDYIIYPYHLNNGKQEIYTISELEDMFPLTYKYLSAHKDFLVKLRKKYKTNPEYWYGFHRSRDMQLLESKKIITSHASKEPSFSIIQDKYYYNQNIYGITLLTQNIDLEFLLAILNSRITNFYIKNTSSIIKGGFYLYKTDYLIPLPLPKKELFNKASPYYNKIIKYVAELFNTYDYFNNNCKNESEKRMIQSKLDLLEKDLNNLVYELYGLTEDEIKIVEEIIK